MAGAFLSLEVTGTATLASLLSSSFGARTGERTRGPGLRGHGRPGVVSPALLGQPKSSPKPGKEQ